MSQEPLIHPSLHEVFANTKKLKETKTMQVQILSHTQGKLSQSLYYTKWMCLLGILPTNNHTWNNN